MKIELLVPRSGPQGAFNIGDHMEVSEEEGKRLVGAGKARPIQSRSKRKAKIEPDETRGE